MYSYISCSKILPFFKRIVKHEYLCIAKLGPWKKPINVHRQSKNSRFLLWFSISTRTFWCCEGKVKRMPLNPFEKEFIVNRREAPKLKTVWQVYFGINECQEHDDELSFFSAWIPLPLPIQLFGWWVENSIDQQRKLFNKNALHNEKE